MASQLYALGYRCITALDISATVIAFMQEEHQDKEGIECEANREASARGTGITGAFLPRVVVG